MINVPTVINRVVGRLRFSLLRLREYVVVKDLLVAEHPESESKIEKGCSSKDIDSRFIQLFIKHRRLLI